MIAKVINTIKNFRNTFIHHFKNFGFGVAFYQTIFIITYHFPKTAAYRIVNRNKHKQINRYLAKTYKDFIADFADKSVEVNDKEQINKIKTELIIWQCWWQGEENLHGITKKCVDSIKKELGSSHKIIFITKNNYQNYASIPEHVIKKLENGTISLTVFSDILRTSILNQNGGLWIDVTVFLSHNNLGSLLNYDFFTCKEAPVDNFFVSQYRWSTFFMGGVKNHILFDFICKMFFEYWKKENHLIDYFLFDYIIDTGYKNIPAIKDAIDHVPYSNPLKHSLSEHLNDSYDKALFKNLNKETCVYKLSRKAEYITLTDDNKETFYGHLFQN